MSRIPEGSPIPERRQNPDVLARRFFALLKERGDIRRELRGTTTVTEEDVLTVRQGKANDILAMLKSRREVSQDDKPRDFYAKHFAGRLEADEGSKRRLKEIDGEIKAVLGVDGVKDAIAQTRHERVEESRTFRNLQEELRDLQAIEDELDVQDFDILRRRATSDMARKTLEGNATLRDEVERRRGVLTKSPETYRMARLAELLDYRASLKKDHYAMTKSRREYADQIQTLWARGEPVLLTGPTGTGKTELFSHLTKKLYERPLSSLVRATDRTTPAEIFGKMALKATKEGGTDSPFKPGVYVDAIDKGMPFVIDEINSLDPKMLRGLKELYNRGPGDEVVIQEDSGLPHVIQDGFVFGATANVKSEKHKDRFKLDPAEARVFASRKVAYMPKEEVYDLALAGFIDAQGGARLAREDATNTLKHLLEAVELTQQAHEGKQTQFYAEEKGAKKTAAVLETAVIDQGRVLKILSGWPVADARGVSFRDFLEDELLHLIRTEEYPEKDRRLMLQIFVTKGFFNRRSVEEMNVPGTDEGKLEAWGWKHTKVPAPATEVLTPSQVADLDPFELRKARAAEAADDFLREGQKDVRGALAALDGLDLSALPAGVREQLKPRAESELTRFKYDTVKASEYGFSELKIEAHPKVQRIVDAIYGRDPLFVTLHKKGDPDPDSKANPPATLTADKYKLKVLALKGDWATFCPDLPNVPEKSEWYFQALAEHRLSSTIDGDDLHNLTNPTKPLTPRFGQKSFMLAMDFNEFDYDNATEKTAALTPQTKRILKTLFGTEDPTNITRDEVNAALWSDHENRVQSDKAKQVIRELLESSENPDDFELRLMRPDEYQRAATSQRYGQNNLWTHMDGYYARVDGHRNGLLGGYRDHGGAACVGRVHRGYRNRRGAVRLVLSRKG